MLAARDGVAEGFAPCRCLQWLDVEGLAARLEIGSDAEGLLLNNAVNLGTIELRFRGRGWLQGSRPLLQFSFDQVHLSIAGFTLLRRSLPQPPPKRLPFFCLDSP